MKIWGSNKDLIACLTGIALNKRRIHMNKLENILNYLIKVIMKYFILTAAIHCLRHYLQRENNI